MVSHIFGQLPNGFGQLPNGLNNPSFFNKHLNINRQVKSLSFNSPFYITPRFILFPGEGSKLNKVFDRSVHRVCLATSQGATANFSLSNRQFKNTLGNKTRSVSTLKAFKKTSDVFVNNTQAINKRSREKFNMSYSKMTEIKLITISLASANRIRQWAEKTLPNGKVVGEVINAETLHYKTFKPIKGGLFCERIFGPTKDHTCSCGKKFNIKTYLNAKIEKTNKDQSNITSESKNESFLNEVNHLQKRYFCRVCDVEYTYSTMRRTQLGFIQLATPTTHVWYVKGVPSYISILLDMKKKDLQQTIYNYGTLTIENSIKGKQLIPIKPSELYETWAKVAKPLTKQNAVSLLKDSNVKGLNNQNQEPNNLDRASAATPYGEAVSKTVKTQGVPFGVYGPSNGLLQSSAKARHLLYKENKRRYYSKVSVLLNDNLTAPPLKLISSKQLSDRLTILSLKRKTWFSFFKSVTKELNLFKKSNVAFAFGGRSTLSTEPDELLKSDKERTTYFRSYNTPTLHDNCFDLNEKTTKVIYIGNLLKQRGLTLPTVIYLKHLETKSLPMPLYIICRYSLWETIALAKFNNNPIVDTKKSTSLVHWQQSNAQGGKKDKTKNNVLTAIFNKLWLLFLHKTLVLSPRHYFSLSNKTNDKNALRRISPKGIALAFKGRSIPRITPRFTGSYSGEDRYYAKATLHLKNVFKKQLLQALIKASSIKATTLHTFVKFSYVDRGAGKTLWAKSDLQNARLISTFENNLEKVSLLLLLNIDKTFFKKLLKYQVTFRFVTARLLPKQAVIKEIKTMIKNQSCNKALLIASLENIYNQKLFHKIKKNIVNAPVPKHSTSAHVFTPEKQNDPVLKLLYHTLVFNLNRLKLKGKWSTFADYLITHVFLIKSKTNISFYLKNRNNSNEGKASLVRYPLQEPLGGAIPKGEGTLGETRNLLAVITKRKVVLASTDRYYANATSVSSKQTPAVNTKTANFFSRKGHNKAYYRKIFKNNIFNWIINNVYCLSHRYMWDDDQEKNWRRFTLYYYSPRCLEATAIPLYKNRNYDLIFNFNKLDNLLTNPNDISYFSKTKTNPAWVSPKKGEVALAFTGTSIGHYYPKATLPQSLNNVNFREIYNLEGMNINTSFSGAGIVQKLLNEFNYNELKKMDKQNRILLFEYNKHVKKLQKLMDPRSLKSRVDYYKACQTRDIAIRRTKLIRKLAHQIGNSVSSPKGVAQALNVSLNSTNEQTNGGSHVILETHSQGDKAKLKKFNKKGVNLPFTSEDAFISHKGPSELNMILTVLPVLPPDLRPIVKTDGKQATADLNTFYKNIIYRNERLKKFLKDPALNSSFEMKYAQRLVQEAVDNLIQNGKSGVTPVKDARGRLLKSLSDSLKGKQGRFRQYLLGKRVDYSARSVIVVGPRLKLHECGIPKEIALALYFPFLIKRILNQKLALTVPGAKGLIQKKSPLVWQLLREIMKTRPVLLNRAPTLHRLGFQAFQPKLVEGKAILLHPLVCPSFNADFDGDQMAVHVPITTEAKVEAWKLMLARNNLLSPATGEPIILPSQDMVLGCYYLTTNCAEKSSKLKKGTGSYFHNINQVLKAYNQQLIDLHSVIWVNANGLLFNSTTQEQPLEIRLPLMKYKIDSSVFSQFYSTEASHSITNAYSLVKEVKEEALSSTDLYLLLDHIPSIESSIESIEWDVHKKIASLIDAKATPEYTIVRADDTTLLINRLSSKKLADGNVMIEPIEKTRIWSNYKVFIISAKSHQVLDFNGRLISEIIRTTPGKILFNTIINKALTKRPKFLFNLNK